MAAVRVDGDAAGQREGVLVPLQDGAHLLGRLEDRLVAVDREFLVARVVRRDGAGVVRRRRTELGHAAPVESVFVGGLSHRCPLSGF